MIDPKVIDQIRILADAITSQRNVINPKKFQNWEVEDVVRACLI